MRNPLQMAALYVGHIPVWHSQEFNALFDALDTRTNSKSKNVRKERVLRSPRKTLIPANWHPGTVTVHTQEEVRPEVHGVVLVVTTCRMIS